MVEDLEARLARYKGVLPTVSVRKGAGNDADTAATRLLYETYSKDGVFTCPKCGATINDPNEAIEHLATEINEAMKALPSIFTPKKEGGS